ncbi:phospholipid-translocating ATPase [Nematocida homosporus]|uniref:phospholipid-translocating ATPase n=1 Tax=Nematocida homosporus TaxID=1912981 RepID=UPI00221EE3CB|nr:phospholipid-translocating ATPase [Nematocida homosporus]KAI5187755.1 phospholipid-translocating ATPase [Nematocida homosporus]
MFILGGTRQRAGGVEKKRDTPPAEERHFFVNAAADRMHNNLKSKTVKYPQNLICNQKYSILTFLPLVFIHQMKHFLNVFFLFVMISQHFELVRVSHPFTSLFPWLLVQILVYIKEGYDDFKRYRRDKEANDTMCTRYTAGGPVRVPASELAVGDLVVVSKDERVPADAMLLKTLDSAGSLFVRTDQLDGETDWKIKLAHAAMQSVRSFDEVAQQYMEIVAEAPSREIYTFSGKLHIDGRSHRAHEENMLWMNMVIAGGTGLCIVVYTGKDTRAVMNTTQPRNKFGLVDAELNFYTKILCSAAFGIAGIFTLLRGTSALWYITLVRFLIIFSTVIPISLRVNIDWARLVYARGIEKDPDTNIVVRNSSIPEELGRVAYLLTDKTGTLTKNEMEIRKMHTGSLCYTPESAAEVHEAAAAPRTAADHAAHALLLAMCLCNNVMPCEENEVRGYISSSPDEMAMVRWAERAGVVLWARGPNWVEVQHGHGEIVRYTVLYNIRFTSESKRMGVVVSTEDVHTLYMKGADSAMAGLLQERDWVEEEAEAMAREGLRTMVFGRRTVTAEEAAEIAAGGQLSEEGLEALGVTGVEDKLATGVRISLETLRNAGIKVWMLTGDKVETARCVALSSRLFTRYHQVLTVTGVKTRSEADTALGRIQRGRDCLVIDGVSLRVLMDVYPEQFISAACKLVAVACCRCSPTQKAEITAAIAKISGKRVCCIGDGGNDVSMIQQAHVGVGIVGKEGRQASLAADFSVNEFQDIVDLILWHGRNAYKNTAKLAQFIIHRGVTLGVAQGIFSSLFSFCPISIYQGKISIGYVTFYTFLPVFSIVLSKDTTKKVAHKFPELYAEISSGSMLNNNTFSTWMLMGYYQGVTIMVLALLFFESMLVQLVSITFSCLVLNELLMVFLCVSKVHMTMIFSQTVSVLMYLLSFKLLSDEIQVPSQWVQFWLQVLLINIVAILPGIIQWVWKYWMSPPSYRKIQSTYS